MTFTWRWLASRILPRSAELAPKPGMIEEGEQGREEGDAAGDGDDVDQRQPAATRKDVERLPGQVDADAFDCQNTTMAA